MITFQNENSPKAFESFGRVFYAGKDFISEKVSMLSGSSWRPRVCKAGIGGNLVSA